MSSEITSRNFFFLRPYEAQLDRIGALAERYFPDDPNTCLIKLRQFGEELARQTAARNGVLTTPDEAQSDLLRRLKIERAAPREVMDLLHQIRIVGNRAAHEHIGDHGDALSTLKIARQLAIWFHRSFGKDPAFKPGPFQPPARPEAATAALVEELERLRKEREGLLGAADKAREEAEAEARARESAEERARRIAEERTLWEQIAQETEAQKNAALADLISLQAAAEQATPQERVQQREQAEQAAREIDLDEAATRAIIDAQLRARGWAVDTETLRYSKGARPTKGKAMAIAEWPTASGPADYALFVGPISAKPSRRSRTTLHKATARCWWPWPPGPARPSSPLPSCTGS
jgi:type I restriction enzyme R subunit